MHKLHKYCKKHCNKITESQSSESIYYHFGNYKIRVSHHISEKRDLQIIIDERSDTYILINSNFIPRVLTYKEIKLWLSGIILSSDLYNISHDKSTFKKYVILKENYNSLQRVYSTLKASYNQLLNNEKDDIFIRYRIINLSKDQKNQIRVYLNLHENFQFKDLKDCHISKIKNQFKDWFK